MSVTNRDNQYPAILQSPRKGVNLILRWVFKPITWLEHFFVSYYKSRRRIASARSKIMKSRIVVCLSTFNEMAG